MVRFCSCSPQIHPDRPHFRRLGGFWLLQGHHACSGAISQPLHVVAGRHHRHREIRTRLSDRPDELAAHLFDTSEHMLDPRPGFRDSVIPSLLAFGQRLVLLTFPLDLGSIAVVLQPSLPLFGGIAPIGINILARVEWIKDSLKVAAVSGAGGIRHDLADELMFLVDVDRELIAKGALAMFLGPGHVRVLLPPLVRLPISRRRALIDNRSLLSTAVLPRGRNQGGINHLTSASNKPLPQQLLGNPLEQRRGTGLTDPVFKGPDRRPVRDVQSQRQSAEPLIAEPIQQQEFHTLIRQIIQPLQHLNAHQGLRRIRWWATLLARVSRGHLIHRSDQCLEIKPQCLPADHPNNRSAPPAAAVQRGRF